MHTILKCFEIQSAKLVRIYYLAQSSVRSGADTCGQTSCMYHPWLVSILATIKHKKRHSPGTRASYHIAAQPSASWKLSAISIPVIGSVQTMSVSRLAVSCVDNTPSFSRVPCCLLNFSSRQILVSKSNRSGGSSASTTIRGSLRAPSPCLMMTLLAFLSHDEMALALQMLI